ncbi:unnamed protein product [Rotaria socialis]|uniref:Phosphoglycerate mutase n=1 Tax=Rotaria socialis TaxID=392032 RepID=A0A818KXJ0_9BILA|nr:unnamed protein product [Rotaria socialis]CAF3569201.1 unnamed protein product [Rotaria socialis]CAF4443524.1 unnamed protein product [Rotaria socialis]CAF4762885.1 unnamed protein product [Rotaria socialis]
MVDNLTDMMHRELNMINSDGSVVNSNSNNYGSSRFLHSNIISRNISDHNSKNNHYQYPNQQSIQTHPITRTANYSNASLLRVPTTGTSSNRQNLLSGYDTDGAIQKSRPIVRYSHRSDHGYEHLVSPRLPSKRFTQPSLPPQQFPAISRHDAVLAASISGQFLRLIFMRHSERANQALGADWFSKAFRTNTYKAYDQNLPISLPRRRFDEAYEFDTPLTVRGLKDARRTGRAMLNNNLTVDVCLSSVALRCIQTCERVLSGMNRREQIPIRVEPGLFECPHLNQKVVDSFMTKTELLENGYHIKVEYKPLVQKIYAPESLDEYFHRCATVMRGIINRYGNHGGTVLIVTHAPGVLALTDAIKGIRTNQEEFYHTVATYPPLATYIAEYDGANWRYSEQPFSISLSG